MAICKYCGAEIPDNAKFCTECGVRQPALEQEVPTAPVPPAEEPPVYTFAEPLSDSKAKVWDPERPSTGSRVVRILAVLVILVLLASAVYLSLADRDRANSGHLKINGFSLLSGVEKLEPDTDWYGDLQIRNHKGAGSLQNGSSEVWASIGTSPDGLYYFEIYDTEDVDEDTTPLLSMWIDLYDDRIVPRIGDKDAWFFDIWLDARDTAPLTLMLEDGRLGFSYPYNDGSESCDIRVSLMRLSP